MERRSGGAGGVRLAAGRLKISAAARLAGAVAARR